MNYRHAFHAGNPGDCLKHALLVWLLEALRRKPTPFFVLDTHAGVGRYDLLEGDAARTGEWRDGILRLLHEPPPALADYVAAVESDSTRPLLPLPLAAEGRGEGGRGHETGGTFVYPGSPLLVHDFLRPDDRLACCELHPEDAAALKRLFRHDDQVGVHVRDGYEAVRALLPPKQRRGLVLIDPPYEAPGEFERVAAALQDGRARFDHGIYAAWYPIKHRSPVTAFHEAIRSAGLRDVVVAELWLRLPIDAARLNGSGLLVRNPPHGFEAAAREILAALVDRLGDAGAGSAVLRLTDE